MSFQSKVDEFVRQSERGSRFERYYQGDWVWRHDPNPPRFLIDPAHPGGGYTVVVIRPGVFSKLLPQCQRRAKINSLLDHKPPFSVATLKCKS